MKQLEYVFPPKIITLADMNIDELEKMDRTFKVGEIPLPDDMSEIFSNYAKPKGIPHQGHFDINNALESVSESDILICRFARVFAKTVGIMSKN